MGKRNEDQTGDLGSAPDQDVVMIKRSAFITAVGALLDNAAQPRNEIASVFEPYISVAEGADYAAVSPDTINEWIGQGLLASHRVGRVRRLRRSDIDALFASGGPPAPENNQEALLPRAAEILADLKRK